MERQPKYSVKQYILFGVAAVSLGVVGAIILLSILGLPEQGLLIVLLISFPVITYSMLRGFHKGLVKYYGFAEPETKKDKDAQEQLAYASLVCGGTLWSHLLCITLLLQRTQRKTFFISPIGARRLQK